MRWPFGPLLDGRFNLTGGGAGAETPAPVEPVRTFKQLPLIAPMDTSDNRVRRSFDQVIEPLNSLIRQEVLTKERLSDKQWSINVPPPAAISAAAITALFSGSATAGTFWAGPGPAFRRIVDEDLPRPVGLVPGGYTNANISVDDWGRVRAASNGTASGLACRVVAETLTIPDTYCLILDRYLTLTGSGSLVLQGDADVRII